LRNEPTGGLARGSAGRRMTSGREGQTAGTLVAATGSATRRARVAQAQGGS